MWHTVCMCYSLSYKSRHVLRLLCEAKKGAYRRIIHVIENNAGEHRVEICCVLHFALLLTRIIHEHMNNASPGLFMNESTAGLTEALFEML